MSPAREAEYRASSYPKKSLRKEIECGFAAQPCQTAVAALKEGRQLATVYDRQAQVLR